MEKKVTDFSKILDKAKELEQKMKASQEKIKKINNILKNNDQLEVINLHSAFVDKEGYLDTKYSDEGVHLNESGYTNWVNFIKNKISELN